MTVTIFGATGMVGRHLITHALAKGWSVKAFGRQIENFLDKDLQNDRFKVIKGYVFDTGDVAKALKGADAVLSALGGQVDGTDHTRSLGMKNIAAQMVKRGPRRIAALGGLGVLDTPDGKGPLFLQDTYPKAYVAVGREHYAAYMYLREAQLDFTFFCAPNIVDEEANGQVEVVEEAPARRYEVSAGNLALSMVQAIAHARFVGKRVGIGNL